MLTCPRCGLTYSSQMDFCGLDGARLEESPIDPLVGRILGEYRVLSPIGDGGMARVYRAVHITRASPHALKVLFGQLAADKTVAERFRREVQAAVLIHHENVVLVEGHGDVPPGLTFMAMSLLEGESLSQVIEKQAPFSPERAGDIASQIASGLLAVHSLGFVHRDLKPSNVMLVREAGEPRPSKVDRVKLLDFGLVGMVGSPLGEVTRLTATGYLLGTPTYMAPEQIIGEGIGPPTDLYALGVILYEMLTGKRLFEGAQMHLLAQHISTKPPKLSGARGLELLVEKLLEKQPSRRPTNAIEVIDWIDRLGLSKVPRGDAARRTAALQAELIAPTQLNAIPRPPAEPSATPMFSRGTDGQPVPLLLYSWQGEPKPPGLQTLLNDSVQLPGNETLESDRVTAMATEPPPPPSPFTAPPPPQVDVGADTRTDLRNALVPILTAPPLPATPNTDPGIRDTEELMAATIAEAHQELIKEAQHRLQAEQAAAQAKTDAEGLADTLFPSPKPSTKPLPPFQVPVALPIPVPIPVLDGVAAQSLDRTQLDQFEMTLPPSKNIGDVTLPAGAGAIEPVSLPNDPATIANPPAQLPPQRSRWSTPIILGMLLFAIALGILAASWLVHRNSDPEVVPIESGSSN